MPNAAHCVRVERRRGCAGAATGHAGAATARRPDGGDACVCRRINHLKAVGAAHERQLGLLSSGLARQHELLHDTAARVAQICAAIPSPESLAGARHARGTDGSFMSFHVYSDAVEPSYCSAVKRDAQYARAEGMR